MALGIRAIRSVDPEWLKDTGYLFPSIFYALDLVKRKPSASAALVVTKEEKKEFKDLKDSLWV